MKLLSALVFLCTLSFQTVAQLIVNRVDINQLDIEYCPLICDSGPRPRVYIDYGQANFWENGANELRNLDAEEKGSERFASVMHAVNFVQKKGWEVVSFQVTHSGSGSSNQFIYLMRKKRKS